MLMIGGEIDLSAGTTDFALQESRHQLKKEKNVDTSYLRLRALPFTSELKAFVAEHEHVYVIEQNRDGQMGDLVRLEVGSDQGKIRKILHYSGLPCDARFITNAVLAMEAGMPAGMVESKAPRVSMQGPPPQGAKRDPQD